MAVGLPGSGGWLSLASQVGVGVTLRVLSHVWLLMGDGLGLRLGLSAETSVLASSGRVSRFWRASQENRAETVRPLMTSFQNHIASLPLHSLCDEQVTEARPSSRGGVSQHF